MLNKRNTRIYPGLALLISFYILLGCNSNNPAPQQADEQNILNYRYTGSKELGQAFSKVMQNRKIQQLILDMAASPLSIEHVQNALQETGITVDDLKNLQLVQKQSDEYVLSFIVYTREDMDTIRAVAEKMGVYLAEGILQKRAEIEKIIKADVPPGVDWRETAMFIIGCVSLDWNGLSLAWDNGYMTDPREGEYVPEAMQPGGGGSNRELYWGSHNYHSEIAVTSFGDHYTQRQAMPDINWRLSVDAPEPLDNSLRTAARGLVRTAIGRTMIALRDQDLGLFELAEKANLSVNDTQRLVKFLIDLNYITQIDTTYRAAITVLTERDRERITQLRRIGKTVMQDWYDEHYADMCNELSDLTPLKYGVPLANGYYWIWHYIFGIANRELVKSGLFADPYAPEREFKGCIAAVYVYHIVNEPL